jgi:hypothetical protein
MKLRRAWTLMAAGLVSAGLLLAPMAYSAEEGSSGSSSMETSKPAPKHKKAKSHHPKKTKAAPSSETKS